MPCTVTELPPSSQIERILSWRLADAGLQGSPGQNSDPSTLIEVSAQPRDGHGQPCESWREDAASVFVMVRLKTTARDTAPLLGEGAAGVLHTLGLGSVTSHTAGEHQHDLTERRLYFWNCSGSLTAEQAWALASGPVRSVVTLPDPWAPCLAEG